jgi:hypothetical protein
MNELPDAASLASMKESLLRNAENSGFPNAVVEEPVYRDDADAIRVCGRPVWTIKWVAQC